jgi:hypothetical protein
VRRRSAPAAATCRLGDVDAGEAPGQRMAVQIKRSGNPDCCACDPAIADVLHAGNLGNEARGNREHPVGRLLEGHLRDALLDHRALSVAKRDSYMAVADVDRDRQTGGRGQAQHRGRPPRTGGRHVADL